MREVKIIGAGLAGMSAALRLLERGYDVTLYEQDDFVGGMLRAYENETTGVRSEHSYHMFMNWYHNFWRIAEDLDIMDNFSPREAFKFLYKGRFHDMPELVNPGGPQDMMRNLSSGAASPADLFLFMYSMVDLLATPIERNDFLDQYSVNAFMKSRPYMTDGCAELHQKIWYTVWSIASFQASAKSYREFLKWGNRVPVPQLWVLKGNKYDTVMKPWIDKLHSHDHFHHRPLHRLKTIIPSTEGRRIETLVFGCVDSSPSVNPRPGEPGAGVGLGENDGWKWVGKPLEVEVCDAEVIVAVTPGMMASLVQGDLYRQDPRLGDLQYLESEPMGKVELYLNRKVPGVPKDVTVFMDTKYEMTFLDYSQMWPDLEKEGKTVLYLTVSDVKGLMSVHSEERDANGDLVLHLDNPQYSIDYILKEALGSLPISERDIDLRKTSIEMNTGEELFANMVGSWDKRPTTRTKYENLYLAGTYVRNFADVSTIEGAVASGLMAAEAVRKRVGHGDPIEVIQPEAHPIELFQALKLAWAPYAAMATAISNTGTAMGIDERAFMQMMGAGRGMSAPRTPGSLGSLYWDFLPKSAWANPYASGLGPLENYWPDGMPRTPSSSPGD